MAKKAYKIIDGSNKAQIVYAENLTENDRNTQYFCCARDTATGEICNAQMDLVIRENSNYFRRKRIHGNHHTRCCPENDETGTIVKTISHLDRTGNKTSMETLLDKFSAMNTQRSSSSASQAVYPIRRADENEDRFSRRIEHEAVLKNPKNTKELVSVLSTKDIDDIYAGCRVGDILFDSRSVKQLNYDNLPNDKIGVALMSKTRKGSEIANKYSSYFRKNILIFVDPFSFSSQKPPVYFAVQADTDIRAFFFEKKSRNLLIAVYAHWEKISFQSDNVYLAQITNKKQIAILDPSRPDDQQLIELLTESE